MATKHTDGCFQKAEDDEELFTLLARDPLAPLLVQLWVALREEMDGLETGDATHTSVEMLVWRRNHPVHSQKPVPTIQQVQAALAKLGLV